MKPVTSAPAGVFGRLSLFGALSRTPHGVLELAEPGLAAMLVVGGLPPWPIIGLGLLTAFAGYTAVYAINDLVDLREDRERIRQGGVPEHGNHRGTGYDPPSRGPGDAEPHGRAAVDRGLGPGGADRGVSAQPGLRADLSGRGRAGGGVLPAAAGHALPVVAAWSDQERRAHGRCVRRATGSAGAVSGRAVFVDLFLGDRRPERAGRLARS